MAHAAIPASRRLTQENCRDFRTRPEDIVRTDSVSQQGDLVTRGNLLLCHPAISAMRDCSEPSGRAGLT